MSMDPYTVAITSCGRFDLLIQTLESLLPRLEGNVKKIVIIEDCGNTVPQKVIEKIRLLTNFELITNPTRIGQLRSIDKLYSRIETDWLFHCEDDWEFFSTGFISDSFDIMRQFDSCSKVGIRGVYKSSTKQKFMPKLKTDKGIAYYVGSANYPYSGFNFNPGLSRMRDYRIVGPYSNLVARSSRHHSGEKIVSYAYLELGYRTITLEKPYIQHIGGGIRKTKYLARATVPERVKYSFAKRVVPMIWKINKFNDPMSKVRRRFNQVRPTMQNWQTWE